MEIRKAVEENKEGILWGGSAIFLYGGSGMFLASQDFVDLATRGGIAVLIPTCSWILLYYVKKLVLWSEARKKRLESKETDND